MREIFVVLTRGRTGSTPICADINQHPDVVCHQELFRPAPINSPHDMAPSYEALKQSGAAFSAGDYLARTAALDPGKLVGFKALLMDLNRHEGLETFLLETAKIVFLTRDPVGAAISAAIASKRGAFNRHVGLTDQAYLEKLRTRVELDPAFVVDEVKNYAYWSDVWKQRLKDANAPHIIITYEEYVEDRNYLLERVFDFLSVPKLPSIGSAEYMKVTSENVWDDILNADEVRQALIAYYA